MLKLRVITALVLLPIVLGAVFLLDRVWFVWVAGAFFVAGGWEWTSMAGLKTMPARFLWMLSLIAAFAASEYFRPDWLLTCLPWLWVLALVMVVAYPKMKSLWKHPLVLLLVGYWLLVPSWAAVVHLQDAGAFGLSGAWALLFVLVWVWAADTGAYFAGRALGKHKLAPAVSPGKTIEGLCGGALLAMLVILLAWWTNWIQVAAVQQLLLVALVTVLASVLGDLFESMIKREAGMKDSGRMLPGHGGMLDRIDSITAALPVAVAGLSLVSPAGGL